jgi:hypothetical protein
MLSACFKCHLKAKVLEKQVMTPLPALWLPPTPVFHSTAVDLSDPLRIKETVKKRISSKCWGVLFCGMVSSVSEDYGNDSFILCFRRFINLKGKLARFRSDPGDQLIAAAMEISRWDYSQILELAASQSRMALNPRG